MRLILNTSEMFLLGIIITSNTLLLLLIILNQNKRIMGNQTELAEGLKVVTAQVAKIGTEITLTLEKVTALEQALANAGNVTPEVQEAFDALKTQVIAVDDLIIDTPTPPTE